MENKQIIDARGELCPLPVVRTKKALEQMNGHEGIVEVYVDNEIAVQNLEKLAGQKNLAFYWEQDAAHDYKVWISVHGDQELLKQSVSVSTAQNTIQSEAIANTVVVISSQTMGEGSEELGKILLKGFIYALTQLDELPATLLFYNGGAALTTNSSAVLGDLRILASEGVEILTCGTCLDYYKITDQLAVGGITNMYVIAEKLAGAAKIIKP